MAATLLYVPSSDVVQDFGTEWLKNAAEQVLLVPSVLVSESQNAVINPLRPRYAEVVLTSIRDFQFDSRMY